MGKTGKYDHTDKTRKKEKLLVQAGGGGDLEGDTPELNYQDRDRRE